MSRQNASYFDFNRIMFTAAALVGQALGMGQTAVDQIVDEAKDMVTSGQVAEIVQEVYEHITTAAPKITTADLLKIMGAAKEEALKEFRRLPDVVTRGTSTSSTTSRPTVTSSTTMSTSSASSSSPTPTTTPTTTSTLTSTISSTLFSTTARREETTPTPTPGGGDDWDRRYLAFIAVPILACCVIYAIRQCCVSRSTAILPTQAPAQGIHISPVHNPNAWTELQASSNTDGNYLQGGYGVQGYHPQYDQGHQPVNPSAAAGDRRENRRQPSTHPHSGTAQPMVRSTQLHI